MHFPQGLFSSVCEAAASQRISIFTKTPPTLQGIESDTTHAPYAQSTISSYVETVATAFSIAYGFKVLQQRSRLKRVVKHILACGEHTAGERRKRQGVRRRHLRAVATTFGASTNLDDINLWAAACLANSYCCEVASWHTCATAI